MAFKFSINGADFSDCVAADGSGLKWKRSDLDSEEAGRTMDSVMHRARRGIKRSLVVKCVPITAVRAQLLSRAVSPETISVNYTDMELGDTTKTFYGTDIEGGALGSLRGVNYWKDISFTLTEV